ncbi:DUF6191 domain-containing protein [Streptomyces sp. NBC_00378]|uniref:DUF6191 domain-containing protein n=1 Tax=unclassified Streptomyces TaxID=2593676 RepID=UPI00225AB053|nr:MULTISPECIES: DUF6191 domain-containing protein [unclassified Streptomyces]MCX5107050.1 DUF6191 domain-containing protein [Streptomyces sp. NBC_00378]
MRHHRLSCLSYHQVIGAACTGGCAPLVSRLSAKHRCPEGENPCSLRLAVSLSSYGCSSLCGSAGGGGASAAEAWGELFHPSQRHVQQERERQLVLRDDAESGAPPSSVDLDSGKAVIRLVQSPTSRYEAP